MSQLCQEVNTSSGNTVSCCLFAPNSEDFAKLTFESWGYGGIIFLTIPPVLTVVMLAIFAEECYFILLKGDSKPLRNSMLWILGTHPAVMTLGTIGLFVPRAVDYMCFVYNLFVAFSIYKFYGLIMIFVGGTLSFVQKTSDKLVRLNQVPICCLFCLPKIRNSMRKTLVTKWLIQQNILLTPTYGALSILLAADGKLYNIQGVSASMFISIFNALSTLLCMYGFALLKSLTKNVSGIEKVHSVKGKTLCMQLTMFIVGFEGIIFNILAQFDVFPCVPPLNFVSRRRVIFNYTVVLQIFFLGLLARYSFRRNVDVQRQVQFNDEMVDPGVTNNVVVTAMDSYLPNIPSFHGDQVSQRSFSLKDEYRSDISI